MEKYVQQNRLVRTIFKTGRSGTHTNEICSNKPYQKSFHGTRGLFFDKLAQLSFVFQRNGCFLDEGVDVDVVNQIENIDIDAKLYKPKIWVRYDERMRRIRACIVLY